MYALTPAPAAAYPENTSATPTPQRRRRRRRKLAVALVDTAAAGAAAATLLHPELALVSAVGWPLVVLLTTGRGRRLGLRGVRAELAALLQAALIVVTVAEVAAALIPWNHRDRMLAVIAAAAVCGGLARVTTTAVARGRHGVRRVVVVGSGDMVTAMLSRLAEPESQMSAVAACVLDGSWLDAGVPTGHGTGELIELLRGSGAAAVLAVPGPSLGPADLRQLAWLVEDERVDLLVAVPIAPTDAARTVLRPTGTTPVVQIRPRDRAGQLVKEVAERSLAALALLAVAPVLVTLMAWVRLDSPGPALYTQHRIGRSGRRFTMVKLRSMISDAAARPANELDGLLFKVRRDPRITRAGAVLRKYSLDELPQLWNIVRGDMALVGPRPALPDEVDRYDDVVRRRLAVKPGLTGLWQVSGRSDLDWDTSVGLDIYYVDNWSLGLDARILARTLPAVLRHTGAY